jgi:hypothetical protein
VQITRTTPLRLMILHLRQIFLTLASTFIAFPCVRSARHQPCSLPSVLSVTSP